jgi:RHS repeat-associated protein
VYGPEGLPLEQITPTGTVYYYHHDQLGSTRAITNSAGAAKATYTYDPYGNVTACTGARVTVAGSNICTGTITVTNPLTYSGQYRDDESGLIYLRARYYDPTTGQFMSRDPLVATTRSPYAYVAGNPLNATDPTGWDSKKNDNNNDPCPNGVKIPFTDLCLDNPLDVQQDARNFDQNSRVLDSTPVVSTILNFDPFYADLRDSIYAAQGCSVDWAKDLVNTGAAFIPGPGAIAERLGFKGGPSILAGNFAKVTGNYKIAAVIQNNSAWVDFLTGNGAGLALTSAGFGPQP